MFVHYPSPVFKRHECAELLTGHGKFGVQSLVHDRMRLTRQRITAALAIATTSVIISRDKHGVFCSSAL